MILDMIVVMLERVPLLDGFTCCALAGEVLGLVASWWFWGWRLDAARYNHHQERR